jgi:hypothetical protein
MSKQNPAWPPQDGKGFIRGESFGSLLVEIATDLAVRYPDRDFSDAVAQVFVWFDGTLARNRRFINTRRFPTFAAFQAYVRQAVWNAARMADRTRRRRQEIEVPPLDEPIASRELGPEERVQLREMVDRLPEPHLTIFLKVFFDEENPAWIASTQGQGFTGDQVQRIFEEAVDMLGDMRRGC